MSHDQPSRRVSIQELLVVEMDVQPDGDSSSPGPGIVKDEIINADGEHEFDEHEAQPEDGETLEEEAQPLEEEEEDGPPSLFDLFNEDGALWCRFCGTSESPQFRNGPWGSKTLCNRHGVAYKGLGTRDRIPTLDLSEFENEEERNRPVIQEFCCQCGSEQSADDNPIVLCDGCPWSYHQRCYPFRKGGIETIDLSSKDRWFCRPACADNVAKRCLPAVDFNGRTIPAMLAPRRLLSVMRTSRKRAPSDGAPKVPRLVRTAMTKPMGPPKQAPRSPIRPAKPAVGGTPKPGTPKLNATKVAQAHKSTSTPESWMHVPWPARMDVAHSFFIDIVPTVRDDTAPLPAAVNPSNGGI